VFLLALALIVFLPMVGARDIVTSHEARVAQTARQMAAVGWPWATRRVSVPVVAVREVEGMKRLAPLPGAGTMEVNPWLVPVMNGQVRLQKPPLPYWCAAVLFRMTGSIDRVSEGAARVPCALLGAIAVLFVYDLGRMLQGRLAGWFAGLVWVSSYFVFDEFRKAMADPYLAFFSLLCVWAWVRGAERMEDRGWRMEDSASGAMLSRYPRSSIFYPLLFYTSLALGALAKAPINFLHVGIALAAYHVCYRKLRPPGGWWAHLLGVAVFLAIALPWPVYIITHVRQMNTGPLVARLDLWRYESVGELADNTEKARGWWFYGPSVLQIALPWTPLWIVGVVRAFVRRNDRRAWFPVLWFAATLVVFSLSHVKKNAYLLPVMPAMALTAAQGLAWLVAGARLRRTRGAAEALLTAIILVGVVFALALPALIARMTGHVYRQQGLAWVLMGVTGLAAAVTAAVPTFSAWRNRGPRAWVLAQAIVFAVLIVVFFDFANAADDNRRSAKPVCRIVRGLIERPGSDAALLTNSLPEEASVYLPLNVAYDPDRPNVLVIVDDRSGNARRDFEWFQARLPARRVVAVRRLAPSPASPDQRWKLYEVTVERKWLANAEETRPAQPALRERGS
jgi:4-amino-4-deoxy-L-arabinose transferase-like glycosyltransferase